MAYLLPACSFVFGVLAVMFGAVAEHASGRGDSLVFACMAFAFMALSIWAAYVWGAQ
jgi:hypothetical protein